MPAGFVFPDTGGPHWPTRFFGPIYRSQKHPSGLLLLHQQPGLVTAQSVLAWIASLDHEPAFVCVGEPPVFCVQSEPLIPANPPLLGKRRRAPRLFSLLHFRRSRRYTPTFPALVAGAATAGETAPEARPSSPHVHPDWLRLLQRTLLQKPAAPEVPSADLVSHLSHELRSPLSAILGNVEFLSHRLRDAESVEALEMIQANSQYLLDLLNQILDMSKLQANKLVPDLAPVSLNSLIGDVFACVRIKARQKNILLRGGCYPPVPQEFLGDACRIRQILINLLDNALKFTPAGGEVHLLVRLLTTREMLQFEVKDTGVGIEPEHLDRLFKPFSQAHADISRRYGGCGLGLSISLELARLMGGTLEVSSEPGIGTSFRLSVPTGPLWGTPRLQFERWRSLEPPFPLPLPLLFSRVLLLDFGADSSAELEELLHNAGASVRLLRDVDLAVTLLNGQAVDLLVVHTQLPTFESYADLRPLRAAGGAVPVLVVGPPGSPDEAERALTAGGDAFVEQTMPENVIRKALQLLRHGKARYPFHVLVVDDQPMAASVVAAMLRSLGCRVEVARSAAEARELCRAHQPDLALLDLELGDASGFPLLDQLSEIAPTAEFVAHTGHGPEALQTSPAGRQFARYLPKPVSLSQLGRLLACLPQRLRRPAPESV